MSDLSEVIKSINKNFKQEIISNGLEFEPVPKIPFSSPRLNYLTYGGLPQGRLVEFFGDEGGGKSTTALDIVASTQRLYPERKILWVDVERTLDGDWASKLGVDTEKLVYFKPNEQSGEEIMQAIKQLLETDEFQLCVLDSIGALVSAQEYDKTIEEATYGGIARPLTRFSKELIPICARSNCLFIGINQMRDDLSNPYSNGTTTGGRAWRHACSMRMEFRKGDYVDAKGTRLSRSCENPAGNIVKVAMVKSKVCKMNRKVGYYTLNYRTGIDNLSDLVDIGLLTGIIKQGGAWYSFVADDGTTVVLNGEEAKYKGREGVKQAIANIDELRVAIERSLEEANKEEI